MKRKINNSESIPVFRESLEHIDEDSKIFVDKSLAITHYLDLLMQHRHLRQKDLAQILGKSEAEVSKWFAGMHNYTLRSLAKLEAAFGTDIVFVHTNLEFAAPRVAHPIQWSLDEKYTQPRDVDRPRNYQALEEVQKGGATADDDSISMAA